MMPKYALPKPLEEFWTKITPIKGAIATTELLLTHPDSPIKKLIDKLEPIHELALVGLDDVCECEHGFICGAHADIEEFEQALDDLKIEGANDDR